MRTNVSSVVECFQTSPDTSPFVDYKFRFRGRRGVGHFACSVGVNPLLDFNGAGAVVEFVGYVRGLRGDVADLADEGELYIFMISSPNSSSPKLVTGKLACVTSTSSILASASGCGMLASRICLMVTGRKVSLPYVP